MSEHLQCASDSSHEQEGRIPAHMKLKESGCE